VRTLRKTALMTALLLSAATGSWFAQGPARQQQRLNVVLLIIDDARWDSLGAAGNSVVRTPRIDQLAKEGVRFEQARPKGSPFALTVGFFAPHAEDSAPEQYLPQDWSARFYQGVKIPPPSHGDPKYTAALPRGGC